MHKFIFSFLLITVCLFSTAQSSARLPDLDKSSMDVSYYPNNYPILKIQNKITEPLAARVIYSRPLKQGRKVFGELVEYGKIWRLGANEATEIEFFKDIKINNQKISKGRYTLYAIANESTWTLIVNKDTDVWGAFKYDPKKDVVRIDLAVEKTTESLDALTMAFETLKSGFRLIIAWDQERVSLPIGF